MDSGTEMSQLSGDIMELLSDFKDFPNDFPDEILRDIFSQVPLKPLTRLMTFSKSLYDAVCLLRNPITTSYGLVLFLNGGGNRITTTLFGTERFDTIHENNLSLELFDSRNGRLLYGEVQDWGTSNLYVVTAASLPHWDPPPLPPVFLRYCRLKKSNMCFRLLCDGDDDFTVMIHDYQMGRDPTRAFGKLFNSKTGIWRDFETVISGADVILGETGFMRADYNLSSSVFMNGKLYSIWSTCLLIYDSEHESFELVKLPQLESLTAKRTMLFESEGRLRLCAKEGGVYYQEGERYNILYDYNGDRRWERRAFIAWNNMVDGQIVGEEQYGQWCFNRFSPIAFNEDLQILYFVLGKRNVVAYSFVTGKWTGVVKIEDGYQLSTRTAFLSKNVNLEGLN